MRNKTGWWVGAFAMASTALVLASLDEARTKRITAAATVLRELLTLPDSGIPDALWQKASCAAVIPSVKKAAFIFGGEYGKGLVSCRTGSGWSAPSFVILEKGSFGLQIGGTTVDLVLLVMNESGVEKQLRSKVAHPRGWRTFR